MWWIYAWGVVLALGVPLAVILVYRQEDRSVGLVLGTIALAAVIAVPDYYAYPIARSNTQADMVGGFKQTLDSNLIKYEVHETLCYEDGPCEHEDHSCDPETHMDPIKDDKGNVIGYNTWIEYHDCPFMSAEYSFTVTDKLGRTFTIASGWFAVNPVPWDSLGILVNRAGADQIPRGIPPEWQAIKDRIDRGDAPPVTGPGEYESPVLGAGYTEQSDDIPALKKAGLLVPYMRNLTTDPFHDRWLADKIQFVGMKATDSSVWRDRLMRFNAGLGMEKHGDMFVVAVKASALDKLGLAPDDYIRAWKAYSQNEFGKSSLPKNAIIVALGIDNKGTTIKWARAETGMPIGNGEMMQAIALRLHDKPFTPDSVLGKTTARVVHGRKGPDLKYTYKGGLLPKILISDFPFKRSCMKCEDADEKDQQGFIDLQDLIEVSTGQILLWGYLLATLWAALWAAILIGAYGFFAYKRPRFMYASSSPSAYHGRYRPY